MGPGGLPKGLLADLGRPGPRLGPFWCAPGCSWAPLGALLAALGAVLGPLGPLLGPPEQLPGELFLELCGSLFLNALGKKRKPWIPFFNCFEGFVGCRGPKIVPTLYPNLSRVRLGASSRFLAPFFFM